MKISELIKKLNEFEGKHGDVDVFVFDKYENEEYPLWQVDFVDEPKPHIELGVA